MKTTFLYFPGMLAKSSASENYLKKQNQEVRLVAIKSTFFRIKLIPLSFFANTPFSIYSAFTSNGPHLICFSSIEISVGTINSPPPQPFRLYVYFSTQANTDFFIWGDVIV